MLRTTPKRIWRNAKDVKVRVVESKFGEHPERGPYFETLMRAKSTKAPKSGQKRETHRIILRQYGESVETLSKGGILTTRKSWVHCDCSFFLFHCEVALTKYKASAIINSNGALPVITNPKLLPRICKHLIACIAIQPNLKLPEAESSSKAAPTTTVPGKETERKPTKMEQALLDLLGET